MTLLNLPLQQLYLPLVDLSKWKEKLDEAELTPTSSEATPLDTTPPPNEDEDCSSEEEEEEGVVKGGEFPAVSTGKSINPFLYRP